MTRRVRASLSDCFQNDYDILIAEGGAKRLPWRGRIPLMRGMDIRKAECLNRRQNALKSIEPATEVVMLTAN